jgi:hypothetical protein
MIRGNLPAEDSNLVTIEEEEEEDFQMSVQEDHVMVEE